MCCNFLTNHAHVMLCVIQDPDTRLRDIAQRVGITERAAQRIVCELVDDGHLSRVHTGRRNHYEIPTYLPMNHSSYPEADFHGIAAVIAQSHNTQPAELPAALFSDCAQLAELSKVA